MDIVFLDERSDDPTFFLISKAYINAGRGGMRFLILTTSILIPVTGCLFNSQLSRRTGVVFLIRIDQFGVSADALDAFGEMHEDVQSMPIRWRKYET